MLSMLLVLTMVLSLFAGCGGRGEEAAVQEAAQETTAVSVETTAEPTTEPTSEPTLSPEEHF